MLVQSIMSLAKWSHRHGGGIWFGDFPIPSDIAIEHCIQGDQWIDEQIYEHAPPQDISRYPFSATTSYGLPLSYDTLFLLARGSQSYGTVNVVASQFAGEVARVHLTVRYLDRETRDYGAKVCLVKRRNDQIGVGIFTQGPKHAVYFETTVVLPRSKHVNQTLRIKNFETDVPNTSHMVGDLIGFVEFQHISLRGTNAPIHVKSMLAHQGTILTSNSPIEGIFNTSGSLSLKTSNAPIKVDIGLQSHNDGVAELMMHTSNSKLESDVSLTSSMTMGGRYLVTASTSNSPLHIRFPTAPVDSTLKLQATATNSPASVLLHPSYEGNFVVTSSMLSSSVKQREVEDPSGRGRRRIIEYRKYGKGTIKGSVSWSSAQGPGLVRAKSSHSQVNLEL